MRAEKFSCNSNTSGYSYVMTEQILIKIDAVLKAEEQDTKAAGIHL